MISSKPLKKWESPLFFSHKNLTFWVQLFTLFLLFCGISFFVFYSQTYHWEEVWKYRWLFVNGWITTVQISILNLFFSLFIGVFCALALRSGVFLLEVPIRIYIEVIRGTPLLVQILFFYYVVAHAIGIENRYVVGIITLSLFSGAYIAEIVRAGIENIRTSQLESAKAIGLSSGQTYRYIVFPQAIRQILPPLAGQFASIIKDSSLLSIIGINELTNTAQQINSATYSTLESFFPLAAGYLILTLPISMASKWMERRFTYET